MLAGILMSVFNSFAPKPEANEIGYSEFLMDVQSDRVSKVVNDGLVIEGERTDGSKFTTVKPPGIRDDGLINDLVNHRG